MGRKRKETPELVIGMASETKTVKYQPGLNLRAEPSKESAVIRVLRYMETVEPDTEKEAPDGWLAVKGGGYVMREFLK